MFGNTGPFSYSPRGISPEDLIPHRRGFQQDDHRNSPFQRNSTSRPSAKSIYIQRKEYSETLNKHSDNFHYRVEHLFTCELDGQEMKDMNDGVAKLKRLDVKGRLWPQDMIMELQGGYLLLTDIETKAELESLPLSSILETNAVLDSCAYNSLLTITVLERNRRFPQVLMFQCEEVGAEHIKGDLDKAVQSKGPDVEPRREQLDIRSNLENIMSQPVPGGFRQPGPRPMQRERIPPPPPGHPPPQWNGSEPETMFPPPVLTPQDDGMYGNNDMYGSQNRQEEPPQPKHTESERNTDIFNHVLNDVEIFVGQMSAAGNAPAPKEKSTKKKKKKKSSKKNAPTISLPPWEEYVSCLQKIKYGFNLLGNLEGELTNPSAVDFVHFLFSTLGTMVPQYPPDLPPSVLSPLLTEPALVLLSQVVSPEEDQLWRSLGDSWNIPRSRWPDGDMIPPYIPEFYDGWQPPPLPAPSPSQNGPMSRSNSQRFTPGPQNGQMSDSQSYPPRDMQWQPEEPKMNSPWGSPPLSRPSEPLLYMRVIYDFMARNNQELSVMKGDVVQVVDKTSQWWKVRNVSEEEGHVPQNVLEPMDGAQPKEDPQQFRSPPPLDMMSSPAAVKAWLEFKGFSKITVRSLGVLNGQLLLGMTRDDMRTVCPEEGGKVFFQLQAIKSAIALASEPAYGRY